MSDKKPWVIWVGSARCEKCGELPLSAFDSSTVFEDWPVPCTIELAREGMRHPECGGRIALAQVDAP